MSYNDLRQVRSDLDTIQSAIGLEPRWDPREIRINLLFAAAGLAAAAWALAPHNLSPLFGLWFLSIPVFAWLRGMKSSEAHMTKREIRGALRTTWLALPLVALFAWCRQLGLAPLVFLGLALFLIGTVLFSAAVGEMQLKSPLGWAAALMLGGLLLPLEVAPAVAVFAGTIAMGGLASAALVYATREESTSHGTG